jgi:KDO2-lipid IV(A) lauroyltransferase
MRKKPRLLVLVEYALARVGLGFATVAPERVAYGLAGALGRLFFRLSKRRQRIALRNLRLAFGPDVPERELLRIGRVSTGNTFKAAVDTVRLIPVIAKGELLSHIVNPELLREVPRPPAWILSGHFGAWEVAGMAVATLGTPCHAIGRRFKNPLLDAFVFGNRERAGLFVHGRRGGIRAVANALRSGAYGLQIVDQNQRLRGVFAPWFGELASCERAASVLALRFRYPILIGACVREGHGMRYRLLRVGVIDPVATGDHDADVLRLVTTINAHLEGVIRRYPEQYLWIHDRYRTRPEDPAGAAGAGEDVAGADPDVE